MLFHTAFYKFVELADPDAVAAALRELTRELTGSILVASEGINGVVAATATALDAFETTLAQDPRFQGAFVGIAFKRSGCTSRPFFKMRVHVKREIVAFGMNGVVPPANSENSDSAPQQGDAISDPAMCGSCHVVETAILDAKKTYNEKSFNAARKSHEQTTYLEWLNSSFQFMPLLKFSY